MHPSRVFLLHQDQGCCCSHAWAGDATRERGPWAKGFFSEFVSGEGMPECTMLTPEEAEPLVEFYCILWWNSDRFWRDMAMFAT